MTGTASSTIISGLLPECRKALRTFRRLTARACFWPLPFLTWSSRSSRSWSRQIRGAIGVDVALLAGAVPALLLAQQLAHVLGAHAAAEVLAEAERRAEAVLELTEERL